MSPYNCFVRRCLPGYAVVSQDGQTATLRCQAVEQGTFKDVHSNAGPQDCPLGGKSEKVGADSVNLCICVAGEYRNPATFACSVSSTWWGLSLQQKECNRNRSFPTRET